MTGSGEDIINVNLNGITILAPLLLPLISEDGKVTYFFLYQLDYPSFLLTRQTEYLACSNLRIVIKTQNLR